MILSSSLPPDKEEVFIRKSFFRFVFVISLCSVLGFVSHYLISRYPLKTVLLRKLKVPETYKLEIDRPSLRFRKGLIPVMALGFGKLELKQKKCSMQTLVARDVLVILRPLSFFLGEFRPRRIYVNDLQINQPQACFFPRILNPKISGESRDLSPYGLFTEDDGLPVKPYGKQSSKTVVLKKMWRKIDSLKLKKFFSEISNILHSSQWSSYQPLSIRVRETEFKWIQNLNQQIVLKAGFFIKFGSVNPSVKDFFGMDSRLLSVKQGGIQGRLRLNQLEVENKKIFMKSDVRFSLGKTGLKLGFGMNLREGKIKGDLKILNTKSPLISLAFNVDQLPVSFLDEFLTPSLHYLWFDCSGELSSSWEELDQKEIRFNDCALNGPYGNLIFSDIQAGLFSINKTKINISELNLDKILKDRGSFQLSGIFDSFGIFSASGSYLQEKLKLRGFLENSRIIFSKNHFRDLQSISKTSLSVRKDQKQWGVIITDMDMEDGDFQGEFRFEMDRKAGWISGAMDVPRMQLSPAIYKLMLGSEPTPLKLSGKFFWSSGVVEDWSVDMEISLLRSKTYEIRGLKAYGGPGPGETSRLKSVRTVVFLTQTQSGFVGWIPLLWVGFGLLIL